MAPHQSRGPVARELGLVTSGEPTPPLAVVTAPSPAARGASAPAVSCSACDLVIATRVALLLPRYCPRCLARRRLAVQLKPSPARGSTLPGDESALNGPAMWS
jgi:hypothetical protein